MEYVRIYSHNKGIKEFSNSICAMRGHTQIERVCNTIMAFKKETFGGRLKITLAH